MITRAFVLMLLWLSPAFADQTAGQAFVERVPEFDYADVRDLREIYCPADEMDVRVELAEPLRGFAAFKHAIFGGRRVDGHIYVRCPGMDAGQERVYEVKISEDDSMWDGTLPLSTLEKFLTGQADPQSVSRLYKTKHIVLHASGGLIGLTPQNNGSMEGIFFNLKHFKNVSPNKRIENGDIPSLNGKYTAYLHESANGMCRSSFLGYNGLYKIRLLRDTYNCFNNRENNMERNLFMAALALESLELFKTLDPILAQQETTLE